MVVLPKKNRIHSSVFSKFPLYLYYLHTTAHADFRFHMFQGIYIFVLAQTYVYILYVYYFKIKLMLLAYSIVILLAAIVSLILLELTVTAILNSNMISILCSRRHIHSGTKRDTFEKATINPVFFYWYNNQKTINSVLCSRIKKRLKYINAFLRPKRILIKKAYI